ncbi:discoidin domain-containing protein [Caulobacter soli]|uniref:discoidin domain-containing protein n=1 Tax=Caulobacter soli TaxID=2708539 RepID=UPI0013ECE760|nr:discoidin domain-containing protein [Caulobacter soli]
MRFTPPLLVALAALVTTAGAAPETADRVTVDLTAGRPANLVDPEAALGAGLDGMGRGEVAALYTPHNVARMRQGGLQPISYRLRTELGIEAWHWNEAGVWSDPAHAQGYWTSNDRAKRPILLTHGYALPRRGDSVDQANNLGYSRLDDGDPDSFWKSNPYLDPRYTHTDARPEWAVLDLGQGQAIGAARIGWAQPYAVAYEVQHWVGVDEYDPVGRWVAFPGGVVDKGQGGEATLAFDRPVETRFVRVLMKRSSGTAPAGATDARDRLGFAIRELAFGAIDTQGRFVDVVRHAKDGHAQTYAEVSSTDPWHRAVDRDLDLEQPGLDRVFASGLTNGQPMMVPVGVLYDTPENAAALIRFLRWRKYPVTQVELGEEPDGQYVDAETYGALYLEFAAVLRGVDPSLTFGGPSLQSGIADTWLDPDPDHSWTRRLMRYLRGRNAIDQLGFFSFERYPFDDICGDIGDKLMDQTRLTQALFKRFADDEIPADTPWVISEYGFSAYSGRAMVEMPSALLNADIVGQFLTLGGDAAYLFGYGPNVPINQHLACAGYGNMMLWQADATGAAQHPMPAYWAARMMTQDWAQPGGGTHALWPASTADKDAKGRPYVTAYALRRPDGRFALMLVNRDAGRAHAVRLGFQTGGGWRGATGAAQAVQYSPKQYVWKADGPDGHPTRNLPPERFAIADAGQALSLPANSLTMVVLSSAGPAGR